MAIRKVWKASRKHAGLLACNLDAPPYQEIVVPLDSIVKKLISATSVTGLPRIGGPAHAFHALREDLQHEVTSEFTVILLRCAGQSAVS